MYRTRAINHRGFYSKITILSLKLPYKRRIKTAFLLKALGVVTKQVWWLMARVRYLLIDITLDHSIHGFLPFMGSID